MKSLRDHLSQHQVSALPEDSLLRLRPVRHALLDPYFNLICRPIDCTWHYNGYGNVMSGYNPVANAHFFAVTSTLNTWLNDPVHLGRELNSEDRLVREVMCMTHDYLHSWAYRLIDHIEPGLGVNRKGITPHNLDDFAYVHLLTEAAAVVGLDYWYLCVKGVDARCQIGSLTGPVTVNYREALLPEYRRFNAHFTAQTPTFFSMVVKLFCESVVERFSLLDIQRSHALSSWLTRELLASEIQRVVTRRWLAHIGGFTLSPSELSKPLPTPSTWKLRLARELGKALWKKIKMGAPMFFPTMASEHPWRYKRRNPVDFSMYSLHRLPRKPHDWSKSDNATENFSYYLQQFISQYHFPRNTPISDQAALRDKVDQITSNLDETALLALGGTLTRITRPVEDPAPLEMIYVN